MESISGSLLSQNKQVNKNLSVFQFQGYGSTPHTILLITIIESQNNRISRVGMD